MRVDLINIFISAALDVLQQETGAPAHSGNVRVLSSAQTSEEVTVMVGMNGDVRGMVLLGMSEKTAAAIVSLMMGEECLMFDDMAQSGIAELGNVITGMATQGMERQGLNVTIAPPALIAGGPGILISTINFRRFVVKLHTSAGDLMLHAAVELAPEGHRAGLNGHLTVPAGR